MKVTKKFSIRIKEFPKDAPAVDGGLLPGGVLKSLEATWDFSDDAGDYMIAISLLDFADKFLSDYIEVIIEDVEDLADRSEQA